MGGARLPGASPAARRHWPAAPRAPAHWLHRPPRASLLAVAARPGIRVRWPQSGSARCPRRGGRSPSLTSSIPQVTLRFAAAGPPHRASGRGGPFLAAPRRRQGPRWRLPNSEPLSISAEAAGRACALGRRGALPDLEPRRERRCACAMGTPGWGAAGGGHGEGDRERAWGSAPSRGSQSRPALCCRPARSTPPPRCLCSPLAMCGAPSFEARVIPTVCSSPLPPQQRAGVGVTSLLRVLGVWLGVSPCQRTLGVLVTPQGVEMWQGGRVPGMGPAAGGVWWLCWEWGWLGCPCSRWIWCFFWERFGQSELREMPRGLKAQDVWWLSSCWVLAALRSHRCLSAGWAVPAGTGMIHKGPVHTSSSAQVE